jgi:hypothetical protein
MLKDSGVYIINLMARSYEKYNQAFHKINNSFENLFLIENNEDLNKIHFCFKTKYTNDDYVKIYKDNLENFERNLCLSMIEEDYKRILNKVVDLSDKK